MKQYFDLLGHKVRDRIPGAEGVVASISFDLYGCVQADMNRGFDKDGKRLDNYWFDAKRLEVISDDPLMPQPSFETMHAGDERGPAEKLAPGI